MTKISIESSNVLLDVQVESASEALQQLSQTLFQNGYVKASYESAVIAREQEFPTGLQRIIVVLLFHIQTHNM